MSRKNDYTTGSLLDYSYYQNYYKLININLSKQTNTNISQQINFIGAKMFLIAEKQQKTILNFSLDLSYLTDECKINIKKY